MLANACFSSGLTPVIIVIFTVLLSQFQIIGRKLVEALFFFQPFCDLMTWRHQLSVGQFSHSHKMGRRVRKCWPKQPQREAVLKKQRGHNLSKVEFKSYYLEILPLTRILLIMFRYSEKATKWGSAWENVDLNNRNEKLY